MLVSKAAGRYATALLELSKEQDSVEETLKDILSIKDTIDDSRELELFLKSPIVKPDKKAAVLLDLFKEEVGELVNRFVQLIAKKKRTDILDTITRSFVEKYNEYAGIIKVEVRVAQPLNDDQKADLEAALENTTGKTVILNYKVQPDLKGGLAVKIDDTVIDGTVKHKLDQLKELFLETSME